VAHRGFAFHELRKVPAGPDDLGGTPEMGLEISDDSGLGLDGFPFAFHIVAGRIVHDPIIRREELRI
jgi:hypothetical protein